MTILSFEALDVRFEPSAEEVIANISAPGPQIEILRTLSFLQLLKFDKAKYPYFFNLRPRGRDIGLFSRDDGTSSSS